LGFFQSTLEFWITHVTKTSLGHAFFFQIKKTVIIRLSEIDWTIAMLSIERMGLLIFAGISFPAEVGGINLRNKQIHFI
jgi:hypothetical protein